MFPDHHLRKDGSRPRVIHILTSYGFTIMRESHRQPGFGVSGKVAGRADVPSAALIDLGHKLDLGSSVLKQARALIRAGAFGSICSRLLVRAGEILDEADEVLVGLNPQHDHEWFAQFAALHEEFEALRSLVPREYRRA